MTFASPAFLLALLLVPLVVAGYLWSEHGHRRGAERFAAPAMLESVAPVRPGWRRHAPVWLYGVAATVLALALARPQATVAVPVERAAVILAIDQSGSMQARDVEPTRLAAARRAALDFVEAAPDQVRVGTVTFNHAVRSVEPPTTDRSEVEAAIDSLRSSGGTATGEALDSSLRLVAAAREGDRRPPPAAIVLLSDGTSTHGRDPIPFARQAAERGIPIYTVALGTDEGTIQVRRADGSGSAERVPPDRETLRELARLSGGRYHEASDASELDAVYENLGSQVSTRPERREITAAFAAGAALLMLSGGAASLRWFGRLP